MTGIPVVPVKVSVYVISSLSAGVAAILMVGWLGSVTNGLGVGYELQVIAATVIGGTDLMGGYGIPYAAVIGAALIEIVRNALLLAGVDPYWQGTFVGLIIAGAIAARARASNARGISFRLQESRRRKRRKVHEDNEFLSLSPP